MSKEMKEFTGDYEHCLNCGHTWDYQDDACPECGAKDITTLNAKEVMSHYAFVGEPKFSEVVEMLERHGD